CEQTHERRNGALVNRERVVCIVRIISEKEEWREGFHVLRNASRELLVNVLVVVRSYFNPALELLEKLFRLNRRNLRDRTVHQFFESVHIEKALERFGVEGIVLHAF